MLYFVRHGQSQANAEHVFAGQRYVTRLTPLGKQQAEQAGRRILEERLNIDRIITSPVDRAFATAKIIAKTIGMNPENIQRDARFTEYDVGELSGRPTEGATPAQRISAPGAEDPKAFQKRVMRAVADAKLLPGTTLIVSHAGVGRMIEATRIGLDAERFYELPGYPNAKIVKLGD